MARPLHKDQLPEDGIHIIHAFEYANSAARIGATGLVAVDVGKVSRQLDNETFYILTNHSPVTWSQITDTMGGGTPVLETRQIISGAGLVGGGDLSADRTLDVVAANGSIVVGANDISVGALQNDAMHGNLGGGSLHAAATTSVNGFMSAADKVSLGSAVTDISTLQSDVTAAEANIVTLQSDVTAAEADIVTLQADVTAAEANIVTLQGQMATAMADIVALQARGEAVRVTNTDTTTNIASTVDQTFDELFGTVAFNDNGSRYSVNTGTAEITLSLAGRYRIDFAAAWDEAGGTARNNLRIYWTLDGIQTSPNYQNNYLRDASGHEETGQTGTLIVTATAGQVLQLRRQRISGAGGTMTLEGTNNFVYVEYIR